MKTIALVSTLALSAVSACASSPDEVEARTEGAIEVRYPGNQPVSGTAFTCSDHPATVLTPCDELWTPQRGTWVTSDAPDTLEIHLSRSSIAADGAAAIATITLQLDGPRVVRATARESAYLNPLFDPPKQQPALDGWIEPVEVSPTPEGRSAGRFSLTFDWGTVSGTYDTAR